MEITIRLKSDCVITIDVFFDSAMASSRKIKRSWAPLTEPKPAQTLPPEKPAVPQEQPSAQPAESRSPLKPQAQQQQPVEQQQQPATRSADANGTDLKRQQSVAPAVVPKPPAPSSALSLGDYFPPTEREKAWIEQQLELKKEERRWAIAKIGDLPEDWRAPKTDATNEWWIKVRKAEIGDNWLPRLRTHNEQL